MDGFLFRLQGYHPVLTKPKTELLSFCAPQNHFSTFTFSPDSMRLCGTFSEVFMLSKKASLVTTCMLSIYVHIVSKTQRALIFSPEKYQGCYKTPWEMFVTLNLPMVVH